MLPFLSIEEFKNPDNIKSLYDKKEPTVKKRLQLLSVEDVITESERQAVAYFKGYVRGLDASQLRKLLMFLTGSDQNKRQPNSDHLS